MKNLSLEVPVGSVYGILGPNGSGKSTTLGMILGIVNPDSGNYSWFNGLLAKDARKRIGAMLEQPNFYPYLTAWQNLKIVCQIKRLPFSVIDPVLERVNLLHRKDSKFKTYSTGMKQRLAIASTLLADPDILVFDEPTNGLDPQGIAEVRELIHDVAASGKTILLASHILDEVEKVCTHVAVIKFGDLLAQGSVEQILGEDFQVIVSSEDIQQLESAFQGWVGLKSIKKEGKNLVLGFDKAQSTSSINKDMMGKGIYLSHISIRKKRLEEQFLEITA